MLRQRFQEYFRVVLFADIGTHLFDSMVEDGGEIVNVIDAFGEAIQFHHDLVLGPLRFELDQADIQQASRIAANRTRTWHFPRARNDTQKEPKYKSEVNHWQALSSGFNFQKDLRYNIFAKFCLALLVGLFSLVFFFFAWLCYARFVYFLDGSKGKTSIQTNLKVRIKVDETSQNWKFYIIYPFVDTTSLIHLFAQPKIERPA